MGPNRLARATLALALVLFAGCTTTWGVRNPQPNVAIGAGVAKLSVDAKNVPDEQEVGNLIITDFRQTLINAGRNMAGSRFVPAGTAGAFSLVIDQAVLDAGNIGNIGQYLSLRFRARWLTPDGQLAAEVAGVAEPRNPTETGSRHLSDVVEVMYEQMVAGLSRTMSSQKTDN